MRKQWCTVATVGLLCVVAAGLILAQDKPPKSEPVRPDEEKLIREASEALARAFEKGDAKAVAEFFTEEGEYHDEGHEIIRGREAIGKAYADFFAKRKEVKVQNKVESIRFLGKDSALEEGTFTVTAKDAPANPSRYSTLYLRQDGRWLIGLLKEWGDEKASKANIEDLSWLIGTWRSENGESISKCKYEWGHYKKFIYCDFSVQIKLKDKTINSKGTQVIGVDPAVGLIHSWTFDSEGGIGEASWTWDSNRWVIHSSGTLHDGTELNATNLMTPAGNDSFTWRSVSRTTNGEPLPDLLGIKVVRVKE
jgi:uncharacterized protein (TIGR02246 family)